MDWSCRVQVSDKYPRDILVTAELGYSQSREAQRRRIKVGSRVTLLFEAVEAYAQIEDRAGRQCIRVIDIAAVVGAVFKTLGDGKAIDHAKRVVTIFGIEAVIVLAEDRLAIADLVVNAS